MASLVPFESGNLPAYLKQTNASDFNSDLLSHASSGFPVISIKGKVFTVVRNGERKIIPNPKDPDSPASSIDMVIVKANKGTSKVWYAGGYEEGANQKPDCFSNDGVKPDASVEKPQCKTCAACAHNQWGSKVGEGGGKGKACGDSVRIAVATPNSPNDPYLIRVPASSIRALGELGQTCAKRGVAYNMVVTKIGFDMETPTPKLTFKPIGFVDDKTYAQVVETAESETVRNILGSGFSPAEADAEHNVAEKAVEAAKATSKATVSKSKVVTDDEVVAAVEKAALAAPAKKAAMVEADIDLDLDGLSFDD